MLRFFVGFCLVLERKLLFLRWLVTSLFQTGVNCLKICRNQIKWIIFNKLQVAVMILSFGPAYIQPSIAEKYRGQDSILDIKESMYVFGVLTYQA